MLDDGVSKELTLKSDEDLGEEITVMLLLLSFDEDVVESFFDGRIGVGGGVALCSVVDGGSSDGFLSSTEERGAGLGEELEAAAPSESCFGEVAVLRSFFLLLLFF